jgi:hypothetical protein
MDIYKDIQSNIWEYYDKNKIPYADTAEPRETLNDFFAYMYRLDSQIDKDDIVPEELLSKHCNTKMKFAANTIQFVSSREYLGFYLKWYNEKSVVGVVKVRMSTGAEVEFAVF